MSIRIDTTRIHQHKINAQLHSHNKGTTKLEIINRFNNQSLKNYFIQVNAEQFI